MQDPEQEKKMNKDYLQPSDIGKLEIEKTNNEAQELTRYRKCRILCSRESIPVTVVVLSIGGGQYYIFLQRLLRGSFFIDNLK